jgi:hypothetical protein
MPVPPDELIYGDGHLDPDFAGPAPLRKRLTVLVCGGRHYANRDLVLRTLNDLSEPTIDEPLGAVDLRIVTGGCPTGADAHAIDWAVVNWSPFREFKPDWNTYGLAAGPIRNQRMLDEGKPDLVLAFPGGSGTADMVSRARAAGVEVIEVKDA